MILLVKRRRFVQQRVEDSIPNPFRSIHDFLILLWLTPDDFTHEEETSIPTEIVNLFGLLYLKPK